MSIKKYGPLVAGFALTSVIAFQVWQYQFTTHSIEFATQSGVPPVLANDPYHRDIQSIFDSKCVACHSCFNSPCQLDLTSFEAVTRGAHKDNVYTPSRLTKADVTRIYRDAATEEEWRKKGFFSVFSRNPDGTILPNLSPIYRLVDHKIKNPTQNGFTNFQSEESRFCPAPNSQPILVDGESKKQIEAYLDLNPYGGMPYGLPPLSQDDADKMLDWLNKPQDKRMPSAAAIKYLSEPTGIDVSVEQLTEYENYFNETGMKSRLVSRYIYEHLFLAHIYFAARPTEFYLLIRAKNGPGDGPPVEIPTRRPTDDPAQPFFYRLKKISHTLTNKNHIPYLLTRERIAHWRGLFNNADWAPPTKMPGYGKMGANPFLTFAAIPAKARYQFLLDDSYFHVMTFIKGPVCMGNTALNVIDDNFWVMFVDPDRDITVSNPAFFKEAAAKLTPPAAEGNGLSWADFADYDRIRDDFQEASALKYKLYAESGQARDPEFVWDGDGRNRNALLTVFRHTDSAFVMRGAQGGLPKTVWLLDYPIFEDIYYNLVAGFDVYGSVLHQLRTRLHMDASRVAAQDMFLSLLPQGLRTAEREKWTTDNPNPDTPIYLKMLIGLRDLTADRRMSKTYEFHALDMLTDLKVNEGNAKEEVLEILFEGRLEKVRGTPDLVNAKAVGTKETGQTEQEVAVETLLQEVTTIQGSHWTVFPDSSLVRIDLPDNKFLVYSLIQNREHFNVSFTILESLNLRPEHNTINFVKGYATSYPNFYFVVPLKHVSKFVSQLKKLEELKDRPDTFKEIIREFGITRFDQSKAKDFWTTHQWFVDHYKRTDPVEGAILDLNRYANFTSY